MHARKIDLAQHEMIKARLRIIGSSLAQISRELGISHATTGAACAGYSRSRRVEKAIADKLKVTPSDLWPDRNHDPNDRRST